MCDKTGWESRDQQLEGALAHSGGVSQALGPDKENNYALGSLDGYMI